MKMKEKKKVYRYKYYWYMSDLIGLSTFFGFGLRYIFFWIGFNRANSTGGLAGLWLLVISISGLRTRRMIKYEGDGP